MDIFVPTSRKEDAIAGPLTMVTWVTSDAQQVSKILCNGYHQTHGEWMQPTSESYEGLIIILVLKNHLNGNMFVSISKEQEKI